MNNSPRITDNTPTDNHKTETKMTDTTQNKPEPSKRTHQDVLNDAKNATDLTPIVKELLQLHLQNNNQDNASKKTAQDLNALKLPCPSNKGHIWQRKHVLEAAGLVSAPTQTTPQNTSQPNTTPKPTHTRAAKPTVATTTPDPKLQNTASPDEL